MAGFVLYFVVVAAAMVAMSHTLPGFHVDGFGPALIAAAVLGAVNALVKPILFLITLPLTILTLGLFLLVLNAICLWLTARLVPGFDVRGAGTTLIASLLLAAVGVAWKAITSAAKS
jgi:putative membrane protein